MRRIYLLLLFLIPLSLLAACSSDDEIAIATLEISKTTVDFKSEASEQSRLLQMLLRGLPNRIKVGAALRL